MSTTNIYGLIPTKTSTVEVLQAPFTTVKGTNHWPGESVGDNQQNAFFNSQSGRILVEKGIKDVLSTSPGERLMLMDYGVDLIPYLFEPLDDTTAYEMREAVITAISSYFGEVVKIMDVKIEFSDKTKYQGVPGIVISLLLKILDPDPNLNISDMFVTTVEL
jgi:phage baseplate assembly protein W